MQTTNNNLSILQSLLKQLDLSSILELLTLAMDGKTSQQHTKVYQMLNIIQQNPQTYLYLTFIICNKTYNQNIRYMAAITMNSALKRNAKQIHFQQDQKTIMKTTLLQNYMQNSPRLISVQNILISQFATCFQQMDWQLITFLVQKISVFPQILKLLIIIFEDLKHNSENYCYFQGNQQIHVIKYMIQNVHSLMTQLVPNINFGKNFSTEYNNQVESLIKCVKLMKTITFHIPHKIASYLEIYCKQVLQTLLQKFSNFVIQVKKQGDLKVFFSKWESASRQSILMEQLFQSINEIVQTKADYIVGNQNIKNYILSFDTKPFVQVKQMNTVLKTWTNIILELLFIEEAEQLIGNHLQTLLPNILSGMLYTHVDQLHIKQEMELEHNPYSNQQNDDDQQNFESTYGKNHGSTLRKLSITCIEKLSLIYSENLWSISRELIQSMLLSENYKIYQGAILYLGVIAEACSQQMEQSIHNFVKYLFGRLNDKHQIVVATSLWTLEKLSGMFSDDVNIKFQCYKKVFQVVAIPQSPNISNNTKILMMKQSAISLLDQLIGLQVQIDPNIYQQIVKSLLIGLRQFTGRALFNIFKAFSSIFQKQQKPFQSEILSVIIAQMCQKWSISIKNDSIMCPLIQCLVIVCQNRRKSFINYGYDFLMQITEFLGLVQRKSLLLRTIDFVSAIVELAKQTPHHQNSLKIIAYVSSQTFLTNLHKLMASQQKQIKNFSYGLLSDIIKLHPLQSNYAQQFIKTIARTIDLHSNTSANNALMCITDLITIHRQCGVKYIQEVMQMVVSFIFKAKNNELPRIYLLNFSRMFGRLSVLAPQLAKTYLLNGQQILASVSNGLRGQQESQLTMTSYQSLLKILNELKASSLGVLIQTKQAQKFLQSYMQYSYNFRRPDQVKQFSSFLYKLKELISQNNDSMWHQYLSNNTNFLPAVVNKIINMTQSQN